MTDSVARMVKSPQYSGSRLRVWGSVGGPVSHIAFFLSFVVSSAFNAAQ